MTGWRKRQVVDMAREAGLFTHKEVQPELERFAELVRADEREACAKVCEDSVKYAGDELAKQIRARGQA